MKSVTQTIKIRSGGTGANRRNDTRGRRARTCHCRTVGRPMRGLLDCCDILCVFLRLSVAGGAWLPPAGKYGQLNRLKRNMRQTSRVDKLLPLTLQRSDCLFLIYFRFSFLWLSFSRGRCLSINFRNLLRWADGKGGREIVKWRI